MSSMKATRFHRTGEPEVLVCEDVPRPQPGVGEVLVRIEATGVNFADVVRRRGDPYPFPTPLPYTLGGECIGVVEAATDASAQHLVGQRMFAFPGKGCYAEYVAAPVASLFPVPRGLEPVQGIALFVQGLTAALILKAAARLQAGEAVLVQAAAGGVGLLAVQLARIYGAGLVIGAASTVAKRELATQHGADLALDYTQPGWAEPIRAATQGRGVDIVLEMTGGAIARESMKVLAPFGRSVVYGAAGREPLIVNTEELPPHNHSVSGFFLRPYLARRELIESLLREFGDFVADGRLKIHIGGVFALEHAADAHRALDSRSASGKLVLVPQGSR